MAQRGMGEHRIEVLLLDADGVVQTPRTGWLERMHDLGGPGFVEEAFAVEKTTLTGEIDLKPLLEGILRRRGSSAAAEEILEIWYDIVPDPEVLALVDRVRAAGVRCVLATNQQSYRGGFMQRALGYQEHFDDAFYSCDMGLAKPDPAYFTHIVRRLDLTPERALFVDDVPANVAGAREAGLHADHHPWHADAGELTELLRRWAVPGA